MKEGKKPCINTSLATYHASSRRILITCFLEQMKGTAGDLETMKTNKLKNLIKLKINKSKAWGWVNIGKGFWRIAESLF